MTPPVGPCEVCELPDSVTPKGVWYAEYQGYFCAACATEQLEYQVVRDDLIAQLLPTLELWADCWLACGVDRRTLRDLASFMGFDGHLPANLRADADRNRPARSSTYDHEHKKQSPL